MLVRVAERIRGATNLHAIADSVIAELAAMPGVCGTALLLCDGDGPAVWIGHVSERSTAQTYLDGGYRDDARFARAFTTYYPQLEDAQWLGPLFGHEGVIGMLHVRVGTTVDPCTLTTIAAYISIRLALLDATRESAAMAKLTPRQREVAELVAHGCTNAEIAKMLDISANAVKKHVSRVLAACDASNRTELAAMTGRWRTPSRIDQDLPPTLCVVLRNSLKVLTTLSREDIA